MNGIICIYKPKEYTSFDVVAVIRKLFKTRKVGHGGTLDPMAEGVLPVFMGSATRAVDLQPENDKEYLAGFRFGIETDTQDITGMVTAIDEGYVSRNKMIFFQRFVGEIEQIPPMFSAVQVKGVRLYDLARKGKTVERPPRKITINSIKVEHYADGEGIMRVSCSKGTYIRTLIHDIGKALGTHAVMTSLVRTRSGIFTLDDCYNLDDIREYAAHEGTEPLRQLLTPTDKLFKDYPRARLDDTQTHLFLNGVKLSADRIRFDKIINGLYTIYSDKGILLAIGEIEKDRSLGVVRRFTATDTTDDMPDLSEIIEGEGEFE